MADFNKYIDISFKEKGRDEEGLDCWGLVQLFYKKEYNIILPSYHDCYSTTSDLKIAKKILDQTEKHWSLVNTPKTGDVVLLRMMNAPMHVGIYKEKNMMLHIEQNDNVKLEKLNNLKWKKRILGIFHLK